MGTKLASALISQAATTLVDEGHVYWSEAELLAYLNDGQLEAASLKPDVYVRNEAVQLAQGTKQTLPAGGLVFLGMPRNLGADGATPGRAISQGDRDALDRESPDWHTAAPAATVRQWFYDARDPKRFYVYPPQPAAGQGHVELVYSAVPPPVASTTTPISVDDVFAPALVNYMLARAYSKGAKVNSVLAAKAAEHRHLFFQALGAKETAEAANEPASA